MTSGGLTIAVVASLASTASLPMSSLPVCPATGLPISMVEVEELALRDEVVREGLLESRAPFDVDELDLRATDDDPTADADADGGREVMTRAPRLLISLVAGFVGEAPSCSAPPPPPAVLDCNDARNTVWVNEMIGTCDMRAGAAGPALARSQRRRAETPLLCDASGCRSDPLPLRGQDHNQHESPWLLASASTSPPDYPWPWARLGPDADERPDAPPPRRMDRPPST